MRSSSPLAVFFLLLGNAVPLIGVMFFSWDLFSVLFFYWLENVVVAFWNIPKICFAGSTIRDMGIKEERARMVKERLPTIYFFVFHYGLFTAVHGLFLIIIFSPNADFYWTSFMLPALALLISHGISFLENFLGKKEYTRVTVDGQMLAPYARMMVMHVTVILGAIFTGKFGSPGWALILLTVLKTTVDLVTHFLRHKKLMKRG